MTNASGYSDILKYQRAMVDTLGEPDFESVISAAEKAQLHELLDTGIRELAARYGAGSRTMSQFLSESMWVGHFIDDVDLALDIGLRAVAIERQLNTNAALFGSYFESAAGSLYTDAVQDFLGEAWDFAQAAAQSGDSETYGRIRDTAFQVAQAAFVSRGSRAAIHRIRIPPHGTPIDDADPNTWAFVLASQIEAMKWFRLKVEHQLYSRHGLGNQEDQEKEVAKNDMWIRDMLGHVRANGENLTDTLLPRALLPHQAMNVLADDEAVLLITQSGIRYQLFLATAQGISWRQTSSNIFDIEQRVGQLRELAGVETGRGASSVEPPTQSTSLRYARRANWLYRKFIAPFAKELAGKERLMIANTDDVAAIPFQMLLSRMPSTTDGYEDYAWLIRDYSIQVLPTLELLAHRGTVAGSTAKTHPSYLGIGDPDYASSRAHKYRTSVTGLIENLPRLPETASEVEAVASFLSGGETKILRGREANETALWLMSYQGELANYDIVHFATHGLLAGAQDRTANPSLAMTPDLRSSLADTGTIFDHYFNDPDGALTDAEIVNLKFGADTVILSACDTGASNGIDNDAFSGLAAAFLQTGARTVVASHWPVNSRAAVELITGSITGPAALLDLSAAFRSAQLRLIEQGGAKAHPGYWAPFSIYGAPPLMH